MLRGNEAINPSSVPAKDISRVSHSARPATGRTAKSGGNISEVRIPRLRMPRNNLWLSKKPRSYKTMANSSAINAVMKRLPFTVPARRMQVPGILSVGEPGSILPSLRLTTWSANSRTIPWRCMLITKVIFSCSAARRMRLRISKARAMSKSETNSSATTTRGCCNSVRAMATRWRCPPLRRNTFSLVLSAMPMSSIAARALCNLGLGK